MVQCTAVHIKESSLRRIRGGAWFTWAPHSPSLNSLTRGLRRDTQEGHMRKTGLNSLTRGKEGPHTRPQEGHSPDEETYLSPQMPVDGLGGN